MLIQYKERNNTICKAIISLVCFAFLFNDVAICAPEDPSRNCDTLAPTSRLDPLVNIKEHDGKYTISENKNANTFLRDGFKEDYAYLYLAELNGQFLKKISELLKLGMSPEGVQKHLDGFKRSIARDLGHVDFSRFHYKDMHADPESVYLPYEMNASEGGGLIWLRYYLDNGRVAIEPMDRRNRSTSVSVADAPYKHILISGVPLEGRTLEDQMANLLANVDKALAENGCDKDSVVKQVVFLKGLADKRKSREMIGKHYGRGPPPATSYVIQAPANGELVAIEVIAIPKDSSAKVKRINANMVVVENDGVRFADMEGLEPTEGITDAREQALDIFKRMKKLLTDNGFKFENVARTWIYQGDITGSDPDGQQRYDKLNEARYIFFKSSDGGEVRFGRDFIKRILEDWMIPYPASTGISMNAGTFVMECAAIDTERKDVEIIPIENPRQTPAYLYEKKELRGKKINPLFSRGTAVVIADTATVWVSGTAAIIKGKTVGDDAAVQAEETIENIRLVLNEVGGGLKDIAQARVYVKNQSDYEKVRKVLEEKLGKTTRIDVIAGVCRQDLLVELEGVAYVKNPISKMKKTSPKHASNVLTASELTWIKEALGSLKPENWCHRTALIPAGNGQVMAVRFLKRGKDISILENEVKVMRDMREAGLDVPEVFILPEGKYVLTCDSAPANAVYDVDRSYRAIIYKATPESFIYPEDIKNPDDMEILALNSIGQFAEMLKKGFIHTSLSPLSHSEGLVNPWRWNHKPLGGVENMEEAAAKSNIRLGGVNDFEHVRKLSAGESAYDETVQAVCEWTVVVTYHSLKNGISEEKTAEILKVGFDKFASVMGYGVPEIEAIRRFVFNFHKEFKQQDIPFQNTAEAPVFDELVALVTNLVKKPPKGSAATLIRYMKKNGIFSDNPKTAGELARKRGGNDSPRNIGRELRVGMGAGLILGDGKTVCYLDNRLKDMDIEEIIRQNPELDIAEPSAEQVQAVAARIESMWAKSGFSWYMTQRQYSAVMAKLPPYTEKTIRALEISHGHQGKAARILHVTQSYVSHRIKAIRNAATMFSRRDILERLNKALLSLPSDAEKIIMALERSHGHQEKAARILHVTQSYVSHRIKAIRNAATRLGRQDILERLDRALISLPSYTEKTIEALEKSDGNQKRAAGILGIILQSIIQRIKFIKMAAIKLNDKATLERLNKSLGLEIKQAGDTGFNLYLTQGQGKTMIAALPSYTEEIIAALERSNGNQGRAADILHIASSSVEYRINSIRDAATKLNRQDILERLDRALISLPSYTEEVIAALERSDCNQSEAASFLHTSRQYISYGVKAIRDAATRLGRQDILKRLDKALGQDAAVTNVRSTVAKKPHIGRNGLPMGPGAANITEPLSYSPAQEPKAIIFDIGKVLIDFDHGRMANTLAQYSPHSASEILDIMEKSEATRLIRIGKISTDEFIARIKQEASLNIDSEEFLRIYNDQFAPNQDMIDFAFRLKRAGYKVAALSTISTPHYEHILRLLPAIQRLDGVFVSCKLGMAKPDPKIYEYALEELGVAPHEAIFVDDVDENVTGARGSGMTAIKFAEYKALKTELEDLAPSREQNMALDFKDILISKAYAARDKKETIILALDESWIPPYSGATGLIGHIGRYIDALNRHLGYEGIVFVSGKGEAVASEIARIREDKKVKNSNIIVLCKNEVLSAGGFNVLKGTSEDDSALLVGVNPANLKDISGVRIVEMFMLAMELNSGRDLSELDQTFIDIRAAGGKRMFVFTPIKPYDVGEFKKIYDLQIKALDINA